MKIVIDARMLDWTGIGRYTQALLDNLQDIDHDNQYVVLLLAADFDSWRPSAKNFSKQQADFKPYSLSEQLRLPILLYRLKPDLVHFLHFTASVFYFGRRVITIHDLTLVTHKTARGGGLGRIKFELKYWLMRLVLRSSVKRSDALITDSKWVKKELLRHYPRARFSNKLASRIWPVPLAVDPKQAEPADISRFGIELPFLLYVGNYFPNKNIPRLLESFKIVSQKMPDLALVLAGREDYFVEQARLQAKRLEIADKVVFTGRVSDEELMALYRQAELFVFPSLSEGFGLTPLEAMAQGIPVVSSNASCLPEVLGDAAVYFDPHDVDEMAARVLVTLSDPKELARLRQAGPEQVKKFSWRRMAEQTHRVYTKVLTREL